MNSPRLTAIATVFLIVAIGILDWMATHVVAQGETLAPQWSEPVLITDQVDEMSSLPRLAVDRQGALHVFWMAWVGETSAQPFLGAQNTVFYRRLDAEGWSPTTDVLVAPDDGAMLIAFAVVDEQDFINLTWVNLGKTRSVYLSRAHVSQATMAPAWTTTLIDTPQTAASPPDLVVLPGGEMYSTYAADNRRILLLHSEDYGKSWSGPLLVWETLRPEVEAPTNPKLVVTQDGTIHIVWSLYGIERSWQGKAVYYARSTDHGHAWETTLIQEPSPEDSSAAWINIVVSGSGELHLVWNRGIGSSFGRYHSISMDHGKTWSPPESFFPLGESGQTHWPWIVIDSKGTLHLVSKTGGSPPSETPKYMSWQDGLWSPMLAFPETQEDMNSALAITRGATLHLVHSAGRDSGELLYRSLESGAIPTEDYPLDASSEYSIAEHPSLSSAGDPILTDTTPATERAVVQLPPRNFDTASSGGSNSAYGFIVAVIASSVIIVLALILRVRRTRSL